MSFCGTDLRPFSSDGGNSPLVLRSSSSDPGLRAAPGLAATAQREPELEAQLGSGGAGVAIGSVQDDAVGAVLAKVL